MCADELDGKMSKSARIGMQRSVFSGLLEETHFSQYKLSAQQVQDHYQFIEEKFYENRFMKEKNT